MPAIERPFDLIVVGAGINGAGIARDAALRGLRVLVLDKSGIGGGTTSFSTRLIHGGLRYLEYYEVPLVRESLREREILLRIAPHLVHPLPFLIPIYRGGRRGRNLIRLGMMAYDVLSFDKSLPRHAMLDRDETVRRLPGLDPAGLEGAAYYHDAQVEFPERLTLENILSARERAATIHTYARVDRLLRSGAGIKGVEFTDLVTGESHEAHAPITINAAGPWLDTLMDGISSGESPMIGGTKGSHIVVRPFPGAPSDALYVEARSNGRPYFIVPWNEMYLIGTTDLRFGGDLDAVSPDEAEIDYLIGETNAVIPGAGLKRDGVLYAYAGVRPLPYQPEGSESGITRRHIIRDHAPAVEGLISVIGGKLTTYRNLARQAVDLAYRKMGQTPPPCVTDRIPLPGARAPNYRAFDATFEQSSGLPPDTAQRMLRIYGTRSLNVLALTRDNPALLEPFDDRGSPAAEIPFAFKDELAVTLTDVLLRSTMAGWNPGLGVGPDAQAARLCRQYLGWDEEQGEREITAYREYIRRFNSAASNPYARRYHMR